MRRAALLLGCLLAGPLAAHEGLSAELARLQERLDRGERSAALHLERGELYRFEGDWMAALRDFRRAEELDPEAHELDLAFARVFTDLASWRVAEGYLEAHCERFGEDEAALGLRARVLTGQRRHHEAAKVLRSLLDAKGAPVPEDVMELARAHVRAGEPEAALAALDQGLARLGLLPALQLFAIEIERERSAWQSALARVGTLAALGGRQERWLVLRAELELAAGRPGAAAASCRLARAALVKLDPARRATRAVADLVARLELLESRSSSSLLPDPAPR